MEKQNKKMQLVQQTNSQPPTTEQKLTLQSFIKKISSRKFILSLVGVVVGIMGMLNCSDNTIAIVAFAILEMLSIGVYCIVEGKVDAASVKSAFTVLEQLADLIQDAKNNQEVVLPDERESDKYLDKLPAVAADEPAKK